MDRSYDVIVIGGGHNGLVNAAYLAKAGKRVLLLEQREMVGGATVTEEIYPGFNYTVMSYVVSLLRPEVIRDLQLPKYGLMILPLESTLTPLVDGDYLYRDGDHYKTQREIARFAYPGFGFGSLMFGNIVVQVFGYYLIAIIFIPLGYGQIRLRHWSIKLMLTLLFIWLILGFPLTLLAFLILFATKELANSALPFVTITFFLIYPIIPLLLIAFYRRVDARSVLENGVVVWVKETPLVVLIISGLMIFFALALHVPLLFNGVFPFFGQYLFSFEGILLLDLSFLILLLLTWGVLKKKLWAWWGSLYSVDRNHRKRG